MGNSWYDRYAGEEVGNVEDPKETIVGSKQENNQGASPHNLLTTTIGDQLRLGSNYQSKVISASFKDRGAILPGGHSANGAYWHDWRTSPGYFVSSTYYMEELPSWVKGFNRSGKADEYLDQAWNTLYAIEEYTQSTSDNNSYERTLRGKETPTFPYDFKKLRKIYRDLGAEYQLLWVTPYGNTLLTDFAMEAVTQEDLGSDDYPDLLAVSYSVPDAAGHAFGPHSVEVQDIYLRLDQDISRLLDFLDRTVGEGAYTVFLTADHGVAPVASYLYDQRLPTGIISPKYSDSLQSHLSQRFGEGNYVAHFDYESIYLNRELVKQKSLSLTEVQQAAAQFLVNLEGISTAATGYHLQHTEYSKGLKHLLQNGYYQRRSGDVLITYDPGLVASSDPELSISEVKGTGHGTGYNYDTHVPLVWYGSGVRTGESVRKVAITDIAPTLSMMLNLQLPDASVGQPLIELWEN